MVVIRDGARRRRTRTQWGDRDARRSDLLEAGRHLLERRGYQALTMREVARGAGVTPGTVYTYFDGKEALFAALYAERLERFRAEIAPLCDSADSAEALFIAIANLYLPVYQVFGRELNVWAMLPATARAKKQAEPLITAAVTTLATVQRAVDRLLPVPPGSRKAADRRLALPLLWATLGGLCDQFTGARHLVHPHGWDEMTRFAARTLARGLSEEED